jgi:RND family efflux transporter MFP subunit
MTLRSPFLNTSALVLAVLLLAAMMCACERQNQYVAPPPQSVTVSQPLKKAVTDYLDFTGTTQSIASVDIRARVQGFLQTAYFKEGAFVKKNDLLYIIDPRTYQAAVDKAVADLADKKAQVEKAEVEYLRNQRLYKENATSEKELVNAKATRDSAKANVAASEASLEDAKINLGYCTIYAPLSGRIGRNQVDVGNLVGAGEFTLLTTIKQYDPIYAYFTLNERQLLRLMRSRRKGRDYAIQDTPINMALANETGYPHEGKLDYADIGVDQSTGTMLMRGVFPNPNPPAILPGLFVRLRLPTGTRENALLVTERAIGSDQGGLFVLVVNPEDVVELRRITAGNVLDGMRLIEEGLTGDEWIVVNGIQRARPGAKVKPVRADSTAHSAAGSQSGDDPNKAANQPAKP